MLSCGSFSPRRHFFYQISVGQRPQHLTEKADIFLQPRRCFVGGEAFDSPHPLHRPCLHQILVLKRQGHSLTGKLDTLLSLVSHGEQVKRHVQVDNVEAWLVFNVNFMLLGNLLWNNPRPESNSPVPSNCAVITATDHSCRCISQFFWTAFLPPKKSGHWQLSKRLGVIG